MGEATQLGQAEWDKVFRPFCDLSHFAGVLAANIRGTHFCFKKGSIETKRQAHKEERVDTRGVSGRNEVRIFWKGGRRFFWGESIGEDLPRKRSLAQNASGRVGK